MITSSNTLLYIDWFTLCNTSLRAVMLELINLALDKHTHLLHRLPQGWNLHLPASINNHKSHEHDIAVEFAVDELLCDIDFIYDARRCMTVTASLNDSLLDSIISGAEINMSNVRILTQFPTAIMNILSIDFLMFNRFQVEALNHKTLSEFIEDELERHNVILHYGGSVFKYTMK